MLSMAFRGFRAAACGGRSRDENCAAISVFQPPIINHAGDVGFEPARLCNLRKIEIGPALYQGTASAVPQTQQNKCWALVPAVCFSCDSIGNSLFSASCLVVPVDEAIIVLGFSP
jgi:hypothetical protein